MEHQEHQLKQPYHNDSVANNNSDPFYEYNAPWPPVNGGSPSSLIGEPIRVTTVLFDYLLFNLTTYGWNSGFQRMFDTIKPWQDPRTTHFPLTDVETVYWFCFTYLILVVLSPIYIWLTKPVDQSVTRPIELALNGTAFLLYVYITYEFLVNIYAANINMICSYGPPPTRPYTPAENRLAVAMYLYYLSKLLRMLDTAIFLMRHKTSCITIVHILHHGLMPCGAWTILRYWTASSAMFYPVLHSMVHIFLYLYFFITALGPRFKKYASWKRQLTIAQLTHFLIMLVHVVYNQCRGCRHYRLYIYDALYLCLAVMIGKYMYFYYTAYVIPDRKLAAAARSKSSKPLSTNKISQDRQTASAASFDDPVRHRKSTRSPTDGFTNYENQAKKNGLNSTSHAA